VRKCNKPLNMGYISSVHSLLFVFKIGHFSALLVHNILCSFDVIGSNDLIIEQRMLVRGSGWGLTEKHCKNVTAEKSSIIN